MTYVEILGKENSRNNQQMTCSEALFQTIVKELKKSVSKQKNAYIIALMIGKYTGLRISEVFALDQSDFDFSMQTISVTKKMIYANKQCSEIKVDTQLKNKASKSILPFHHDLQQTMKQWFVVHPHQHVISNEKGQYLNPKQMEHTLWRISARIGAPFHFHMLRHTFASRLIQQGADMKVAQELMRHASITTTMNIYTHISEESKKKALYQAFPIDKKISKRFSHRLKINQLNKLSIILVKEAEGVFKMREYVKPTMEGEVFAANEYIASTCWGVQCDINAAMDYEIKHYNTDGIDHAADHCGFSGNQVIKDYNEDGTADAMIEVGTDGLGELTCKLYGDPWYQSEKNIASVKVGDYIYWTTRSGNRTWHHQGKVTESVPGHPNRS